MVICKQFPYAQIFLNHYSLQVFYHVLIRKRQLVYNTTLHDICKSCAKPTQNYVYKAQVDLGKALIEVTEGQLVVECDLCI